MKKEPSDSKSSVSLDRREFLAASIVLGALASAEQPIYSKMLVETEAKDLVTGNRQIPGASISDFHCLSEESAQPPPESIPPDQLPSVPTEKYPYTIELNDVLKLPVKEYEQRFNKGIAFHMVGDTGGDNPTENSPFFRSKVVNCIIKRKDTNNKIAFFYHLGDVVYEIAGDSPKQYADRYNNQLYEPFEKYDAPIFAVPGSHDMQTDKLLAFCDNFVNPKNSKKIVSGVQMIGAQPNFYWHLRLPFANIIGLSTNTKDKGHIDDDQYSWFTELLRSCRNDYEKDNKALIVAMYYAPLDSEVENAGGSDGSPWLYQLTNQAYTNSKMFPHLVLSGHWHAYQRLNVSKPTGEQGVHAIAQTVHVVVGCGGKGTLYPIAANIGDQDNLFDGTNVVMVKKWTPSIDSSKTMTLTDNLHYGFMEIFIDANFITGRFITVDNVERDTFVIDIKNRKIV